MIVVTAEPRRRRGGARGRRARDRRPGRGRPVGRRRAAAWPRRRARGAERALLVPGDCPALDPGRGVGAARRPPRRRRGDRPRPARHAARTRCCSRRRGAIAPSFGPGSFARHAAAGRRGRARRVRVAHAPSLELDVDTPGDLAALRGRCAPPGGRAAHAGAAGPDGAALRARVTALAAEPLPGLPEIRPGRRPRRAARRGGRAAARARAGRRRRPRGRAQGGREGRGPRRAARGRHARRARPSRSAAEHGKDPRLVELILAESAELRAGRRGPPDRPHAPRLRVRERRRRPVQRRRRGARGAPPGRPGRVRARAAGAARLRRRGDRLVRPRVARRPGRGRDRLRRARPARGLARAARRAGPGAARDRDRRRRRGRGRVRPRARQGHREPAVRLRGLDRWVLGEDGPGVAGALLRAREQDLFG